MISRMKEFEKGIEKIIQVEKDLKFFKKFKLNLGILIISPNKQIGFF